MADYVKKEVDLREKNHPISEKLQALEFLDANRRVYGGKLIPNYSEVAEVIGIDRQLLHQWWKRREKIMERGKDHLVLSQGVKAFKLNNLTDKAIKTLQTRDFTEDSLRDITQALKTFIQYGRLLSNQSTTNSAVEHKHSGTVEYVVPDTEIEYEKAEDIDFSEDLGEKDLTKNDT